MSACKGCKHEGRKSCDPDPDQDNPRHCQSWALMTDGDRDLDEYLDQSEEEEEEEEESEEE